MTRNRIALGNKAAMVGETRFARHFRVLGGRSNHLGGGDCSSLAPEVRGGGCC
jgi:hypothetical protein